jgi:hypothetical protein
MRTEETLALEELYLDESPDIMAAMTLPELRRYLDEGDEEDGELGLRALLEDPNALSPSLRRQLQ